MTASTAMNLKQIEAEYADPARPVPDALLAELAADPRGGARRLHRLYMSRAAEAARLEHMLRLERPIWARGVSRIAGVDEVGIGPLAGPVVAAAVILQREARIDFLNDSKQVGEEARGRLEREIRARATVAIGVVEVEEIDRINVYQAGLLAMQRAVRALPCVPEHLLVDARRIPGMEMPQDAHVKGDANSLSIAAASIVAKVWRDRLMTELDAQYPGYGLAVHKGYPTPAHQAAIRRLGPSALHRRSFDFIRELMGEYSAAFYALREEADTLADGTALAAWEAELRRSGLAPHERRKLTLIRSRLRERLARAQSKA